MGQGTQVGGAILPPGTSRRYAESDQLYLEARYRLSGAVRLLEDALTVQTIAPEAATFEASRLLMKALAFLDQFEIAREAR